MSLQRSQAKKSSIVNGVHQAPAQWCRIVLPKMENKKESPKY